MIHQSQVYAVSDPNGAEAYMFTRLCGGHMSDVVAVAIAALSFETSGLGSYKALQKLAGVHVPLSGVAHSPGDLF